MGKYKEYQSFNLTEIAEEVLKKWEKENTFLQSIETRDTNKSFVFYEGPPSANGLPGIHHVMARSIKDIFCRYKTLKGYRVERKAGWDTHGLPVELGVEKELGITKEDIGKKITVEQYNDACKKAVMRYTDIWNNLTKKMGYWVDMEHPYVTYHTKYIESVWWLLAQIYNKGLLYKGYTIQPYSPKAGTGLSSHELNQPGCYRDVTDTTVVAQFKIKRSKNIYSLIENYKKKDLLKDEDFSFDDYNLPFYFIAWTTTPWTLPSNTALAVNPDIDYDFVATLNPYTFKPQVVILASDRYDIYFNNDSEFLDNKASKLFNKIIESIHPSKINELLSSEDFVNEFKKSKKPLGKKIIQVKGSDLVGLTYEQLLPYALPYEDADKAFRVIPGDFVTTEDGTGIVHIAPTFGADDARVAKEAGVPPMLVMDENDNPVPLVDLQGKFRPEMGALAGKYVKNEYYPEGEAPEKSVDVEIAIKLKEENKAFKVEKYVHSYPHCWRTDKPVLYYPLDSWFIKVTAVKDRLIALNKTINWKPESTGTGRFGNWLENANDWNLSRSRFWGIPIPIWRTEDGKEAKCIDAIATLKKECDKSVAAGFMDKNPFEDFEESNFSEEHYNRFDLHKHIVDDIILVSESGKPMKREADLIDVWFDSGSMPYAQWHYPFENKELIDNRKAFPADFIAEGVDQTRGWFYTLHAIATMCFDSVAYKNVVSNGLVLDKNGHKMSKRLGNAIDPFETLEKYGPDATRWYMITNAQPWDNLKFDLEGIVEVQRKFFRALQNTYSFFALYANIDNFIYAEKEIPIPERPEIDQWIISKLHTLIKNVDESYNDYEPTKAGRLIQTFVVDHLSNWYVRLCRRRFWKGEYSHDKIAAFQTLYECLIAVSKLASPIAPFYCDELYNNLISPTNKEPYSSVHLAFFPEFEKQKINEELEKKMDYAQQISSMVLALRKKENIKVRQPLQKIILPVLDEHFEKQVEAVKDLILSEVNVKELSFLKDSSGILVKKVKPNFKTLGPKYGKDMKLIAQAIAKFTQEDIRKIEQEKTYTINLPDKTIELTIDDVEILTEDLPGWTVLTENGITVALDININTTLKEEGLAREVVNRIQNIRKNNGYDVTDYIKLKIKHNELINSAINNNKDYICSETLTKQLEIVPDLKQNEGIEVELDENVSTVISIEKLN
ncbi:MAG: isoleucine--tRNA ligase [Vicingaceae bacterium]